MAVTKIWAIHDSVSRVVDYCTNPSKTKLSDLEQVLLYAADKDKTLDEGEQQYAVTGIGCRAESTAREMAAVQRRFGKAGGNVAYHAYLDDMIDVFSKDGCEMVDILFDRFLKKYYADIDVSNERMTINLTDEEGHVLSFNLSQSEVHYVLHMVERRLNSFMRDDGGGGFGDKD